MALDEGTVDWLAGRAAGWSADGTSTIQPALGNRMTALRPIAKACAEVVSPKNLLSADLPIVSQVLWPTAARDRTKGAAGRYWHAMGGRPMMGFKGLSRSLSEDKNLGQNASSTACHIPAVLNPWAAAERLAARRTQVGRDHHHFFTLDLYTVTA